MSLSTSISVASQTVVSGKAVPATPGLRVAIIPDGNARWAAARGLLRDAGHLAGVNAAHEAIAAASDFGIHTLTFFVLSSEKASRCPAEAGTVLHLLHEMLLIETAAWVERGVKVSILGRRERLGGALRQAMQDSETATAEGSRLHVRFAVNYSSRETLFLAACRFYKATELSVESFGKVLGEFDRGATGGLDLIIRTGGEQRLGDFLLWESAFAEAIFLKKHWPDFTAGDLESAVREYCRRVRARGAVLESARG